MRKYEFDVDVIVTFKRTVSIDALDEEQAEYLVHRDIRKEFGLECEIEFPETIKTGVAQDHRRRSEIQD